MIKPGLERISRLLAHTPLPWRAIHVAGTNGKGSICAYITAMLIAYNNSYYRGTKGPRKVRHGRFTSPHLVDQWDCITLDGKPVKESRFRHFERGFVEYSSEHGIEASEFEVLTATAFKCFNHRTGVDIGVVEVGMGGAQDATNIVGQPAIDIGTGEIKPDIVRKEPLVSIISKIGMDHQSFLGNTLEGIAQQKAGIIKRGVPVVVDPMNAPEIIEVIRSVAEENGTTIFNEHQLHDFTRGSTTEEPYGSDQVLQCLGRALGEANPKGIPAHVRSNAALAYTATFLALQSLGIMDPFAPLRKDTQSGDKTHMEGLRETMAQAIVNTTFPGRQQWLSIRELTGRQKDILLDGAHNADSARALGDKVNEIRRSLANWGRPVTWLLAASNSKDPREVLRPLIQPGDKVVLVEFGPVDGMPWVKPTPVEELEAAVKDIEAEKKSAPQEEGFNRRSATVKVFQTGRDVRGALQTTTDLASDDGDEGTMVVAGSLYLVGDVLRLLRNVEREPGIE